MSFSTSLKKAREEAGLSKAAFARILEIPYTTYNNYENGSGEPKIDLLIKMANILNIRVDNLLGIDNIQEPTTNDEYEKYKRIIKSSYIFIEEDNGMISIIFTKDAKRKLTLPNKDEFVHLVKIYERKAVNLIPQLLHEDYRKVTTPREMSDTEKSMIMAMARFNSTDHHDEI